MDDFANGGTKVSIHLKHGTVINDVMISTGWYIIAARGFKDLPFSIGEIADIVQTADDKNPHDLSGYEYWDDWKSLKAPK
jgi:hypothetical protein